MIRLIHACKLRYCSYPNPVCVCTISSFIQSNLLEAAPNVLYVIEYLFVKKFLMMLIDSKLFRSNVIFRSIFDVLTSCDSAFYAAQRNKLKRVLILAS